MKAPTYIAASLNRQGQTHICLYTPPATFNNLFTDDKTVISNTKHNAGGILPPTDQHALSDSADLFTFITTLTASGELHYHPDNLSEATLTKLADASRTRFVPHQMPIPDSLPEDFQYGYPGDLAYFLSEANT